MKLEINKWYCDPDTDQRFKVLKVDLNTVEVIDEWMNRRTLNRRICETDFRPTDPPLRGRGTDEVRL